MSKQLGPFESDLSTHLAENSFQYFCQLVLGQKFGQIHQEWIDTIQNSKKYVSLMAPRGHFKTSILSVAFPLWIVFREPREKEILISIQSASLSQSSEIMYHIKKSIESKPALRERLLPDKLFETKWSEREIHTKNGHRIVCVPFGDTIRGRHPHYMILDDILKDETTNIEQVKRTFYTAVLPAAQSQEGFGSETRVIVVGTPMSYQDLLHELKENKMFISMKYQAVVTDDRGEWLTPAFPEHFTLEHLKRIRDMMPAHAWAREYMCTPVSGDSSLFPYETHILPAIDLYKSIQKVNTIDSIKYLGVDIAMSESASADYSVLTEITKTKDSPLVVTQIVRHKGFSVKEVERLHIANNYSRIVVEKTGLGQGPVADLENSDVTRSVLLAFNTNTKSKEEILSKLELMFRNKQLAIPSDDELITELSQFGVRIKHGKETFDSAGVHDDMVMSLAMAVYAAEGIGAEYSITYI